MAAANRGGHSVTLHVVTPEYPPMLGGVADYTHQIATELSLTREKVHVWAPAGTAPQADTTVIVHPVLGRFRASDFRRASAQLDAFPAPRRLIVQWVPHGYGHRAMNVPFCLWLWRRSVSGDVIDLIVHEPFVTFSGSLGQRVLAVVQRAMTLLLLNAARRIWVTTRAWTPLLEPFLAGAMTPIRWLPVPSSLPSPDAVNVDGVRARYAPAMEPLIGHFGTRGAPISSLLSDAIVAVARAHRRARVLLIGSGSENFRSAFVVDHPALTDRVVATGTLDADALSAHIAACDVLLQPYPDGVTSRRTTTMAGLRVSVPVVTTQGPLTEQFWTERLPVKLAPVNDVSALVDHVVHLIADPVERRRQGDAGRAFYDRWFHVRRTVAALTG
jgi:glycosyltransferase involved in cell wall biosynthesis